VGRGEPNDPDKRRGYRLRFDALLVCPLARIEPQLRWALTVAREIIVKKRENGLDWVRLLDDLQKWEKADAGKHGVRRRWAEEYLNR
jgi:CRISPR type I-E-associated protein CasB/Cse2